MTDLLAGSTIKAVDRPAAVYTRETTVQTNITNTTFQPGSPVVDVTFTSPTSGRVMVFVGAATRDDSGAGDIGQISFEVYEGIDATGTLRVAGDTARAVLGISSALDYFHASEAIIVEDLTPAVTHYARIVFSTTGGSGVDVGVRDIGVVPLS